MPDAAPPTNGERQGDRATRQPDALYSEQNERALLGACLLSPKAREILIRDMTPTDFYVVKHQWIAEAVMALTKVGAPTDPVSVKTWLTESYPNQAAGVDLAYLIELQSETPATTSAHHYARVVRDRATRRRLRIAMGESNELIYDLSVDIADVVTEVRGRLDSVEAPSDGRPAMDAGEFLSRDYSVRWLVPGLLERQDRLIFTGSEGAGKSTVLLQMGVQMSVGIHPWRPERFDPISVLIVDLENSERQLWRRLNRMVDCCAHEAQMQLGQSAPVIFDPERIRVDATRNGIDLLTRNDRRWLTSLVAASKPDLLITGPVYKLLNGSRNEEEPAMEVTDYLDKLRETYDVSIFLEAHSPKSTEGGKRHLYPSGTPIWIAWPDFGYGIRRTDSHGVFDWEAWRPPRDDGRTWPTAISHGRVNWPWVNNYLPEEPAF